MVQQASCSCGAGHAPGAADYGRSNLGCVPGRQCNWCGSDSCLGRLCGGFYDNICCPDPCYEPRWIAEANAAFFQDSPRPTTQTLLRWDAGRHYGFPDTAEYFWPEINVKGPKRPTPYLNYNDLDLYQEIGTKTASMFIQMAYRNFSTPNDPGEAGMGDMSLGVKTVLLSIAEAAPHQHPIPRRICRRRQFPHRRWALEHVSPWSRPSWRP